MDFEGIICFAHYNHPFLRNIAFYSVLLKNLNRWLLQMRYSEHSFPNPIFERKIIIAIAEEQKLL